MKQKLLRRRRKYGGGKLYTSGNKIYFEGRVRRGKGIKNCRSTFSSVTFRCLKN